MRLTRVRALVVCSILAAAGSQLSSQQTVTSTSVTVFGVGDIMQCELADRAEATGRLMERLLNETPNSLGITFGDNSNDDGSEQSYRCLNESAWGRLMDRLEPSPGNHDYEADPELPFYYLYFPKAGDFRTGYRAFDVGAWRLYALNSELSTPEARQQQLAWLEADLKANARDRCTLAYFHRPPFSSGAFASPRAMPLFQKLYAHGVDLVATGHEHFFASLPPLTPAGVVDTAYGVPILIAGTGGAVSFRRPRTLKFGKDGEHVVDYTIGVLRLTLDPHSYRWAFIPVDPNVAVTTGGGQCHPNPPGVKR